MIAAGVPQPVVDGFSQASASGAIDLNQLTGVGDLGAAILAAVPAAFRAAIEPFIDRRWSTGIHAAFSLATAQTFWLGVGGVDRSRSSRRVAIKEIPLRATNEAPDARPPTAASRRRPTVRPPQRRADAD